MKSAKDTPGTDLAKILLCVLAGVMIIMIAGLVSHIHSQDDRILSLEKANTAEVAKNKTFQRTLCSDKSTLSANSTTPYSLQSEGYDRTYHVHTPQNYDASLRYPLIVSFDGYDGNGLKMEAYSGLDSLNAVLVYPDSLPGPNGVTSWQGAPYSAKGDRDVLFTKAMLEKVKRDYCIDETKQFAVGMSNGGGFAELAACRLDTAFKAIATVSGAFYSNCEESARKIAVLAFHSTSDQRVPFEGFTARGLPAITTWAQDQANNRQCQTNTINRDDPTSTQFNWTNCEDSSQVRLVVFDGQEHGWLHLSNAKGDVKTLQEYIWNFFEDSVYSAS